MERIKLMVIVAALLICSTCFGASKFVSGNFISGNMSSITVPAGYPQTNSILLFIDSTDSSLVTADRLINTGSLGTNGDMYISRAFVTNYTIGGTNYYDKLMIGTNADWTDGLNPPIEYYGFATAPLSTAITNWLLKGTIAFKFARNPQGYQTYLFTPTTGEYTDIGNNGGIFLGTDLLGEPGGGLRFPVYMSTTNGYNNQYYQGGVYAGFPWPDDGALHWLFISWDNTAAVSNVAGAYPTYTIAIDINQLAGSTFSDPSWPNSLQGPLHTNLPVRITIPGQSASQKLIMWNRPLTILERIQVLSH